MKDLYVIEETQTVEGVCSVMVRVKPDHPIYRAHFPGHPITPGAVLFGIAVRLVASQWAEPKDIDEVKNVKFIKPHYPMEHECLTYTFETGKKNVNVTVSDKDVVFCKMNLIF